MDGHTTLLRVTSDGADADWLAPAVAILAAGGLVAYPTDTLYGLAVDPRSDSAVEGLYRAKGRAAGLALPLIAGSTGQALAAGHFDPVSLRLAEAFWPGPLSIVVPAAAHLSRLAVADDGTIAVRVPAHPVARALALAFGHAITATSANPSGSPAAVTAEQVLATLDGSVGAVLDGGPSPAGPPSTIVEITTAGPRLVRAGPVAWERVLEFLE